MKILPRYIASGVRLRTILFYRQTPDIGNPRHRRKQGKKVSRIGGGEPVTEDIGNKGFCERFSSGKICVSNPFGDVKVWIG